MLAGLLLYIARDIPIFSMFYTAFVMTFSLTALVIAGIGIWSIFYGRKNYKLFRDVYSRLTFWIGIIISTIAIIGISIFAIVILLALENIG